MAAPFTIFLVSRTASETVSPPSLLTTYRRSATGFLRSVPVEKPSSPRRIPFRHPTFPELQSVSHPAEHAIMHALLKSSPPRISAIKRVRWLVTIGQFPGYLSYPCSRAIQSRTSCQSSAALQRRLSSPTRPSKNGLSIYSRPLSRSVSMSFSSNAMASITARYTAASTASPSWLTLAAFLAMSAARSGLAGLARAQVSIKISDPICSDMLFPFSFSLPLSGALIPFFRRRYAVCSVLLHSPPHHRMVSFSTI